MVAFTTLWALCEPIDFVRTFGNTDRLDDRAHRTARNHAGSCRGRLQQHQSAAEATEHRVQDRGLEHVDLAQVLLRRLDPLLDRRRNFFRFAGAVSDDFRAAGSPTTTSAEKLMFLPPLTTLVTRLMLTTCSFRFKVCGSMRLAVALHAIR